MSKLIKNIKDSFGTYVEEVRQGEHRIVFNIFAWVVMIICICPIALVFSCGDDGGVTIWNFVGLAYLLILCFVVKEYVLER